MNPNTSMKTEKYLFVYQDLRFVTCWYLETWKNLDGLINFFSFLWICVHTSCVRSSSSECKCRSVFPFQNTKILDNISALANSLFCSFFNFSSTCLLPLTFLAVLGVFFGKNSSNARQGTSYSQIRIKLSLRIQIHPFPNWYFLYI